MHTGRTWKPSLLLAALTLSCGGDDKAETDAPPPVVDAGLPADSGTPDAAMPPLPFDDVLWVSMNGPTGANHSFFAQDPFHTSHIYLGATRGLYRSMDSGDTWSVLYNGEHSSVAFSNQRVFVCSLHPHYYDTDGSSGTLTETCARVFATASDLYVTNNTDRSLPGEPLVRLSRGPANGATFSFSNIGPDDTELAPALATWLSDTSMIALVGGVYHTAIGMLIRIDVFGADEKIRDSFLMWSDDDGSTWTPSSVTIDSTMRINYLAQDPGNSSRFIFSLTPRGGIDVAPFLPLSQLVFETTNDGRTWAAATTVTERVSPEVRGVAIVQGDYVLTDVDRSIVSLTGPGHNSYTDWPTPMVPNYLDRYPIEELLFDASNPSRVWGRGRLGWDGLIRSTNGGQTWERAMTGINAAPAPNLAVHPSDANVVVACGNLGFLPHITRDGGATWEPLGGTFLMADEVAFDPADPDHIIMISELSEIAASHDVGHNWSTPAPRFTATRVYDMAASTAGNGTLYVSNLGSNISRLDGANTVLQAPEIMFGNMLQSPDYAYDIDVDPNNANILFAGYSPKIFETAASVWRYNAAQATNSGWTEVLEVEGSKGITSVAIDPNNSQRIYAASTGPRASIYASSDGGDGWAPLGDGNGFTAVTVHEVAVDLFDPTRVWAAPWGGGLFESTNGGANWSRVEAPSASIVAIIARGDHLIIADRTKPTIYESGNGGVTWEPIVSLDSERFSRIMSMTLHNDVLYLSAMERVVTSPPALTGATFRLGNSGPEELGGSLPGPVLRFASHGGDLFAVTHIRGVYRLDGNSWTDLSTNLPDMGFFDIFVDSLGTLWVAGGSDLDNTLQHRIGNDVIVNEIYRSDDAGVSWQPVLGDNRFGAPIKRLTAIPEHPEVMVAMTAGALYTSDDRGASWIAQPAVSFPSLGALALGAGRIYVGTLGGGVQPGSVDPLGDVTWSAAAGPYPPIHNLQIEVSPAGSNILYLTSYPGGVFRSNDGGQTWLESNFAIPSFEVADPVLQGYYSLAIDPTTPSRLYLGVYRRGVFRSDNGGATWMPMHADPAVRGAAIRRLAIDPTNTQVIYLATEQGVFRSTNGAASWQAFNQGLHTLDITSVLVDANGRAAIGTAGYSIYVYDSSAATWKHLGGTNGIGEWHVWDRRLYQYSSLLFAPDEPDTIYLGHFPSGFFVSHDGAASWKSQSLGLGNDGIFSLAVKPDDADVLFAGTYNGVVRSDDRGQHWRQTSNGMPAEQWPFDVVIDSDNPQIMYAATKNGQNKGFCTNNTFCGVLMKSTDGGANWFRIMNGMGDDREYYRLIILPANHDVLFVSTDKGVFASQDAGASWVPMNGGLPTTWHRIRDNVARNMWLTADNTHLVLGLVDYSVWRADLSVLGL